MPTSRVSDTLRRVRTTRARPFASRRERWTPLAYQVHALKFMVSRGAAGLLLKPGYRKTSISLFAFKVLREKKYARKMLVLGTLKVVQNTWPAEIEKWAGLDLSWTLLHGAHKERNLRDDVDVYLMNYDGLPWLARQPRELLKRFDILLCDESSKLKDTTTKRFKTLKKLLPTFKRRYLLTGSFVAQHLENVFGQTYVLDLGEAFGPYITHFRNAYMEPTGFKGYDWQARPGAEAEVFDKLKDLMLRLPDNLIDMPPLNVVDRFIELPPDVRTQYDKMESAFVAQLRGGAVNAANAAVATGKLRQLCSGNVYDELGAVVHAHTEKLDALEELIDELEGSPAFVAYEFQHELATIRARFGAHVPYLGAGLSTKEVNRTIADFNAGRIPLLLGQPQSVAHGLNLQSACQSVIFYTLPWSLELYEQFIYRVYRSGQKGRVDVYRILARGTVDEATVLSLAGKDQRQQHYLRILENEYHRRHAAETKGRSQSA